MAAGLLIGWDVGGDPASVVLAVVLLLALRFAVLWVGIFLGLSIPGESTTSAVQVLVWPTGATSGPLAEHAVLLAIGWPVLITAIFLPLSARAYRRLRR